MHAILQPSSAHRWVNCPGSVQAQQQYPSTESDSAREGIEAHEHAAAILQSYVTDSIHCPPMSDEMRAAVDMYVMDVLKIAQDGGLIQSMKVEQYIGIDRVHALNGGTPDCVIYDKDRGKLFIWDFKYGRTPVDAYENWQLINYAIGVLDEVTGGNGLTDQVVTVDLRIVQPRAFHPEGPVRGWTIKGSDLRSYANRLKTSADQSQFPEPPTKAGEWCKYCTASVDCTTLQHETAAIADRIQVLELHNLSPNNAAVEIRYLRQAQVLVRERLEALEAQSLEQIRKGTVIPGLSVGYGRGSFVWSKPDSEIVALGDILGVNLRKPEAPITPTQAKKLNVDSTVINKYAEKRKGTARLVTDDKTIAALIFKNT